MGKRVTPIAALLTTVLLGACSSSSSPAPAASTAPAPSTAPAASVEAPASAAAAVTCDSFTILNHRTDLDQSGDWKKLYVDPFAAKYPGIKEIKTESITDYHNIVKTRLAGGDYGDVLVIPNGVNAADYSTYFAPLGSVDDLKAKYRFIEESGSFEGQVYGIAINGNANGILYNKDVFTKAGITEWPKTPDEFLADLKTVKDKVPGVDPLYTNYKAGWPMSQWQPYSVISVADPDFSAKMAHDASPWDPGKGMYITDKLLYDVVKQGLNEKDPTTTDWEPSKDLVATGKIGVMPLGSWAISQMQGRAKVASVDPNNIAYMPFPMQVEREVPVLGRWRPPAGHQQEHQVHGRRQGVGELLHRRLGLREQRGRHPDRAERCGSGLVQGLPGQGRQPVQRERGAEGRRRPPGQDRQRCQDRHLGQRLPAGHRRRRPRSDARRHGQDLRRPQQAWAEAKTADGG